MLCFEVSLNGESLCTAGVGEYGVLSAILTWVWSRTEEVGSPEREERKRKPYLHVGGLVDNEHVNWLENPFLVAVGDEVSIRVAESEEVDEPVRRERGDDPEIARKRRYFLYQAYRREFEAGGGAERPAELSPEEARGIRRRLYEEYKAEFEGEPSAS